MYDVFIRFLVLGCISFGGPVAHIGYFQREFVEKRQWIGEEKFSMALSFCQFLPGPASTQLGLFIGYHRAGVRGAIAAFLGFTFPSFFLLTFAAIYSAQLEDSPALILLISAAKLLAVVVVADAIWTMAQKFIRCWATFCVCISSTAWILWQTGLMAQLLPILLSGVLGWFFIRRAEGEKQTFAPVSFKQPIVLIGLFLFLLIIPVFINSPLISLFNHFYQAGSFVFGGGHVVLPLLQPLIGSTLTDGVLVEAYAAAQLVPGPMFTIASYIGASIDGIHPIVGSIVATMAIFLPGTLLLFAVIPVWQTVMTHQKCAGSIVLINAAVVGLLLAAFYQPVWLSGVHDFADIFAVLIGFYVMRKYTFSVFSLLAGMLVYVLSKQLFL